MQTRPLLVRISAWAVHALPIALILTATISVVLIGTNVLSGQPIQSAVSGNPEVLRNQIIELERRAGWLQWNLTLILTAAALFTIAQGAFAYFNAQGFVKQADEAVKRIEELAKEVQGRYPMFTTAEQARKSAFDALERSFGFQNWNWRVNPYIEMQLMQRQQLLSVENFVGLEFVQWSTDYVKHLRGMGNFYGYKYAAEGRSIPADFDRALYYLQLAAERTNRLFSVLNDIGVLYIQCSKDLPRARQFLEESYTKNPHQQRAQYNLATIEHEESNFVRSIELLRDALTQPLWETEAISAMESNLRYNLACSLCKKAASAVQPGEQHSLLKECLKELESSANLSDISHAFIKDTKSADDDLGFLVSFADADTQERFQRIKTIILTPRSEQTEPSWKDRIKKAWQALSG